MFALCRVCSTRSGEPTIPCGPRPMSTHSFWRSCNIWTRNCSGVFACNRRNRQAQGDGTIRFVPGLAGLGASSLCCAAVLGEHALVRACLWRNGFTHRAAQLSGPCSFSGRTRDSLHSSDDTLLYVDLSAVLDGSIRLADAPRIPSLGDHGGLCHSLRRHRISPFSCGSGVCTATRGRSGHLGGAVSFCRPTESQLQSPALAPRGLCRHLRSHFLHSRPGSRQSAPLVLGGDGRRLDRLDTPTSSVGRSDGVATCSCLRQVNLPPSCSRFQFNTLSRQDAHLRKINSLTVGVQSMWEQSGNTDCQTPSKTVNQDIGKG